MKDSGVKWIGEIPEEWKVSKMLYCLKMPITDGPHETPKFVDDGIPFISVDSLNESKNINFDIVKKYISEEDYKNYMVKAKIEKGDILFSKAATIGKTAIVGDEIFMVWSPLAIIKQNNKILNHDFLYYLLNCKELIKAIELSGSYNTQANVGMREMERAIIPIPFLGEQEQIALFLDETCSEIDSLYADIEEQIKVLEDYKKSVITEAVTKGLNPNVEMKDSGMYWYGSIPSHWDIKKIKYITRFKAGVAHEGDWDFNGKFMIINSRFVSTSGDTRVKYTEKALMPLNFGDICIVLSDLPNGRALSRTMFIMEKDIYTLNQRVGAFYNYQMNGKFFSYIMNRNVGLLKFDDGMNQTNLQYEDVYNCKVLIPPLLEQEDIANYLDSKCAEIDSTIADKQNQLSILEQYKKSLIYEYVTGKKEVPA